MAGPPSVSSSSITGFSLKRSGFRAAGLGSNRGSPASDLVLIAQVAPRLWPEAGAQLVNPRHPGRDVQLDHLLIRELVEMLHERAEAVPVRRHQHARMGEEVGHDGVE